MKVFKCIFLFLLLSLLHQTCSFTIRKSSQGSKVFLLVLDGFVHDYEKYTKNMPNFAKLASNGVKAERMIPPFPTVTMAVHDYTKYRIVSRVTWNYQ